MTKLKSAETQAVSVPGPIPFDAVYRRMAPSVFGYLKARELALRVRELRELVDVV